MKEFPLDELLPQGHQDMLNAYHEYMAQASDIGNQITESYMKTLHLPLKAKWYEMIESGIKTEEYREIKPYWKRRLLKHGNCWGNNSLVVETYNKKFLLFEKYDIVKFSYGYTKRTMTFEVKEIVIGKGNPEWGAPTEDVFIIKLGNRV